MKEIRIGDRTLGDGHPCFITFEAGPTINSLDDALKLSEAAAAAGGDAIKFQILDTDRLIGDKDVLFSYNVLVSKQTGETMPITEPLYNILKRRELSRDEWIEVKAHCDDLNIAFFATVAFPEEVDFLTQINAASIKIASGDLNHFPLMKYAAQTGLPIQIDTGSSTIGEVENAFDTIRSEGNEKIIINHCPSGYPARLESINLNIIKTLKNMFDVPIAFSDHTSGWDMDIAAVATGANLIEKTISLDRTTKSCEHLMSIEPEECVCFVNKIREIEIALGDYRRIMTDEERERRKIARRSIFASTDLKEGSMLTEDMVDFRRPGLGIPPCDIDRLVKRVLTRPVSKGGMILWDTLS